MVGPWRASAEEAREDALRAAQAHRREDGTFAWRASARLERGGGARWGAS